MSPNSIKIINFMTVFYSSVLWQCPQLARPGADNISLHLSPGYTVGTAHGGTASHGTVFYFLLYIALHSTELYFIELH